MSDVHGNAAGLAAALERMGAVDELLCAGDIVEEFRFSNDAVEILRDRGARCVLGNHDLGLLSAHGARARSAPGVRAELVEWLADQPRTVRIDADGKRLLMTHASPCPPHTQYVTRHSPELGRIAAIDADIVVIGHTHAQLVERVGRVLVVNPGSVGQARDPANGRRLSYAVVDSDSERVTIDNYTLDDPLVEPALIAATGGRRGHTP
ncbi:metallophosphatase family protein [Acidiferrimicrobium sp. IK]|nr:metallophosphatase family protein [Acidiferrimicrobium sp. IK]